jgi:hypothetical protein
MHFGGFCGDFSVVVSEGRSGEMNCLIRFDISIVRVSPTDEEGETEMGKQSLNYMKHKGVATHEEGGKCSTSVWLTILFQTNTKTTTDENKDEDTQANKFKHNTAANTKKKTNTNTKPKYDKTR